SMKLWAMKQSGLIPDYAFELDLHAEVFEACAYHHWGLFESEAKSIATLILGGGVPKNYNLQPEPALGQVLGLPQVRGYEFDVQITTAPVTDGSLSSCPPAEAVTWGKVDKDTYQQSTESLPGDYSMMMPFLIKALMEKHHARDPYRLYEKREQLVGNLRAAVAANREWLMESLHYPLAAVR
ncbi:MAG TPA: deoxyhypusine synthase family protein, partial [Bryobacteraceae bacterium]|nr:deoxyhypusine synthase family protein [Bryobacteraceae bacterium]